jgi:hypothetical protein
MRRFIKITQEEALNSSCTAGEYFIKRMFKSYGKNGIINLSKKLLLQITEEFIQFHKRSRIYSIKYHYPEVHFRCFFDMLIHSVERKKGLRIDVSEDWFNSQFGLSSKTIILGFWRELNRVAK